MEPEEEESEMEVDGMMPTGVTDMEVSSIFIFHLRPQANLFLCDTGRRSKQGGQGMWNF